MRRAPLQNMKREDRLRVASLCFIDSGTLDGSGHGLEENVPRTRQERAPSFLKRGPLHGVSEGRAILVPGEWVHLFRRQALEDCEGEGGWRLTARRHQYTVQRRIWMRVRCRSLHVGTTVTERSDSLGHEDLRQRQMVWQYWRRQESCLLILSQYYRGVSRLVIVAHIDSAVFEMINLW
jgi:hypothetical protein